MQRAAQSQRDGGWINQEGLRELLRLKKVFRVRSFVFMCHSFSAFYGVICDNCVPATWMDELNRNRALLWKNNEYTQMQNSLRPNHVSIAL